MHNFAVERFRRPGVLGKFAFGFAALLLCALALGAYAMIRLHDVERSAQAIRGHWLQTTRALGDIAFLAQRFRVIEAAVVLAPPEGKAAEAKTLNAIRAEIEDALERQAKLVQSTEEQTALAKFRSRWAAYLDLDDRFLKAAALPGDAAAALYRAAMREAIHDLQDALKQAIQYNLAQADLAASASAAEGETARRDILLGLAIALALSLLVGRHLHGAIVRPIGWLTAAMTQLAEGAADVDIPCLARADEIGAMARAAAVFKDASSERRRQLELEADVQRAAAGAARDTATAERERTARAQAQAMRALGAGLRALAEGDLSCSLDADFPREFAGLRDDYEEARERLAETLRAVIDSAAALAHECRDLSVGADDLSARTEQQAASLEQSSAALQQIAATVKDASASATQARAVVVAADGEAKRGAGVVGEAVAAMDGLARSSDEIREITGLIDEIAFQTNLLALNAGVEAARAGEAGRGFAVVATEVRALAQRSAGAAKRISDLIASSGRQVVAGVARVGATGEALSRIAVEISRLNAIVDAVASGAVDQSRGLNEISGAVQEMDRATQGNAAMAQTTNVATRRVSEEIETLDGLVRQFRIAKKTPQRSAA